jgi:hypothetical protein
MHGDTASPPYYSDALLVSLANEAQKEVARRTRCFIDSATADLAVITVTAGTQAIDRDPRVIFIRDVRLASKSDKLWKIKYRDLDLVSPDWLTAEAGEVTHYCVDYQRNKIYFHNKFAVGDTVTMTVVREPLTPMDLTAVNPEVPARWQEKLAHWMGYRTYNNADLEDKYDPEKAKTEYALFEAEFGARLSALDETWFDLNHGYDQYEGLV